MILAGDFNLHVNDENDTDASIFIDTIEAMGLEQHVIYPSHKSGNTLDLVFTEIITQIQINYLSCGSFLSDHCMVDFINTIPRDETKTKTITYRKLKDINPEDMMKDINAMQNMTQDEDLTDIINSLESVLKDALDKHASAITETLTTWKINPWFTVKVRSQKRLLRKTERTYCRYKTNTSWQNFRIQKQIYRDMLKKAKTDAVSNKVTECGNDTKKLYKIVNNILGTNKEKPLPPSDDKDKLADDFANYFTGKIQKIRDQLDQYDKYKPWHKEIPTLSQSEPMTTEEVARMISSMAIKLCKLDAIPTSVLKQITPSILQIITKIINISLTQSILVEEWKTAIVHPLLRKLGSEITPSNYRPVSNLSFLSKLLEKCAIQQFTNHCNTTKLLPDYQSAYR